MEYEKLVNLGNLMATKAALSNHEKRDPESIWKNNIREYPIFSELKGIESALKVLNIDFEYIFIADINSKFYMESCAIKIDGIAFYIENF